MATITRRRCSAILGAALAALGVVGAWAMSTFHSPAQVTGGALVVVSTLGLVVILIWLRPQAQSVGRWRQVPLNHPEYHPRLARGLARHTNSFLRWESELAGDSVRSARRLLKLARRLDTHP